MTDLKLIALDPEDLQVLSAHLQDAVLKVEDIAYLPHENRFAALANRFDWTSVTPADEGRITPETAPAYARRRTALRFERVLGAQTKGIEFTDKNRVLNLLAIAFEAATEDDPSGHVSLIFAGGAAIRLHVECIEAEMRDLGGAWATASKPDHPLD